MAAVKKIIEGALKEFLEDIALEFDIETSELLAFAGGEEKITGCMHLMIRGPKRGKPCGAKTMQNNNFCSKHQKSAGSVGAASTAAGGTGDSPSTGTKKGPTKTQLQIIEQLNTAVPQDEIQLERTPDGLLLEPQTGILFNTEYMAIGVRGKKKDHKIGSYELEWCDKRGCRFDEKQVDLEASDAEDPSTAHIVPVTVDDSDSDVSQEGDTSHILN